MDPATVVNAVSPYVIITNVVSVRNVMHKCDPFLSRCGSIALPGGARRDEGINLWKLLGKRRGTASEFIWLYPTDSVTEILPQCRVLLSGSTGQPSPPTLVPCASIRTQDDALK
ncbi:hypothetical protein B0H13DRAFT_1908502 [Mycena leptocephala]|nr:hypothetical protein B0H13DRAFT_1908502 [Mycena leptocephala]